MLPQSDWLIASSRIAALCWSATSALTALFRLRALAEESALKFTATLRVCTGAFSASAVRYSSVTSASGFELPSGCGGRSSCRISTLSCPA